MTTKRTDFSHSAEPEPHRARTKEILKEHPEIRQYIGTNPYTFLFIIGILVAQVGLAFLMRDQPWWVILLVAYALGSFITHGAGMMIHECSHGLVFKNRSLNSLASILVNLPMVMPSAISFQRYHLKHHAFQGNMDLDADIADYWEAKLVGNSFWGKAFWMLLFPVFQITRPVRLKEIRPIDRWIVLNMVAALAFDVAVYAVWGPKAFFYLLLCFFFAFGLHPLGARWIGEHFLVHEPQETYSYYGPLNMAGVGFNIGYHNEHHDFPSVPWNRLPKVKKVAPERYDGLVCHRSWTKLFFRFLFDRRLSLFSRMVREDRGGVALSDAVKPDAELAAGSNPG